MKRTGAHRVALHDVEPATFERCALIRDWLDDHGIERVTLLVIPAPDLHPFHDRRPEMVRVAGRVRARAATRSPSTASSTAPRRAAPRRSNPAAEFLGLDADETRRAGRGRPPRPAPGRGAPARVRRARPTPTPTRCARRSPRRSTGGRASSRIHAPARSTLAPALTLGTSSAVKRLASPWLVRAGALAAGDLLRLDLHPADLDHPRHIGAVEGVLQRAHRRVRHAVTYDDLAV